MPPRNMTLGEAWECCCCCRCRCRCRCCCCCCCCFCRCRCRCRCCCCCCCCCCCGCCCCGCCCCCCCGRCSYSLFCCSPSCLRWSWLSLARVDLRFAVIWVLLLVMVVDKMATPFMQHWFEYIWVDLGLAKGDLLSFSKAKSGRGRHQDQRSIVLGPWV